MEPDLGPEGEIAPAAPLAADAPEVFSSEREAARALTAARRAQEQPSASAPQATEEPELAQANAEPEEVHGETEPEVSEPDDADALPPIERPRSWAKELDEEWSSYPREAQEKIAKREQERDAAIRRSQNEAAEARKAAQAERDEAKKAREQYESHLPALMQELHNAVQSSFSDIKTVDDLTKLAAEDPFRYLQWQAHQTKLQAAKAELDKAEANKTQEKQSKRSAYEAEQNKLLVELVPEMADTKKANELRERAIKMLTDPDDIGLKDDQLSRWMRDDTGHEILSNAGIQKLIADGLKYRDLKAAPKAVAPKNLPPVTRPGTAPTRASNTSKIQAIQKQLDNATGLQAIRLSAELLRAKRAG